MRAPLLLALALVACDCSSGGVPVGSPWTPAKAAARGMADARRVILEREPCRRWFQERVVDVEAFLDLTPVALASIPSETGLVRLGVYQGGVIVLNLDLLAVVRVDYLVNVLVHEYGHAATGGEDGDWGKLAERVCLGRSISDTP